MKPHVRKVAVGAALVATTLTGGAIGASLIGTSGAQTTSTTTAPSAGAPAAPGAPNGGNFDPSKGGHTANGGAPGGQFDPTQGGHVGQNGVKEVLLTGDTADKVRAAAQAAVPGATIQRVETDAEGSPYEAHMTKSDGTNVTVKVDNNYKVTNIETDGAGFGHGGPPPQSGGTSTTTN